MWRKTEEDVVMRTLEDGSEWTGLRKIGRRKLRWSDVIRSTERRSTSPENVENENSMRRAQIGKMPEKKKSR